jgi:hypothetical protein
MQITDTISIVAASGRNVVSNTMLIASSQAEIVSVTEKAVKVQAETLNGKTVEAWFPKKAFRVIQSSALSGTNASHHTTTLAPWFRASGWSEKFLELTTWTR